MIVDGKVMSEIRKSYRENRLIPFIGSGFSKPLGLPDWKGLIESVAAKIGYEPDLFLLHGNYQQLLEYIKSCYPSEWNEFIHTLRVEFDSPQTDENRKNSETHKSLAGLNFKTIYTTNYDRHIEKALEDNNKKVRSLTRLVDFVHATNETIDCEVIKFHGSIVNEDSMILTETQYFDRTSLEEAVDQRLRSDILSNNFIFIGYSFSDPNIRYIWYKIHRLKSQQPSYSQQLKLRNSFYVTFGNEPVQSELLKKWDMTIVTLDPENFSESLSLFLKDIF